MNTSVLGLMAILAGLLFVYEFYNALVTGQVAKRWKKWNFFGLGHRYETSVYDKNTDPICYWFFALGKGIGGVGLIIMGIIFLGKG